MELVVKDSFSKAEVLRKLNRRPVGGNYKILDFALKDYNIDISHFTGAGWRKGSQIPVIKLTNLQDILRENSRYSSFKLKKRLIKEGYKQHRCENCLQEKWLGNPIPVELDHINGINTDNRLDNLRLLCPNCHALTPNYRGKNKNKSALTEMREVECRKFRETPAETRGNPEPSSDKNFLKGAETRHDKPKVELHCKTCNKILFKKQIYCCLECYNEDKSSKLPKVPEIIEAFKQYKSFLQVGKHFNVSDNSVRKWVDKYGINDMIQQWLRYSPVAESDKTEQ